MKNPYADINQNFEPTLNVVENSSPVEQNEEDIEALCREKICPTCPIKTEADDVRLRSMAEMENFKRRLGREHEEQSKYMGEAILSDMLPALDSLDLAIQYSSDELACKSLLEGVVMTRKLLLDSLKTHGLITVGSVGEAFNHESHEAVGQEVREDMDEMCVSTLLQRGYYLKDRLLRPAKVMVSCK